MTSLDYYKILRVSPTANPREIHESYSKLAVLFDYSKQNHTKEIMELVNEAYSVLRNSDSRAVYDLKRSASINKDENALELTPAEKIVNSWGTSYTIEEEEYLKKIHTINRGIKFVIFIGAVIFLWSVVTFRFDISFAIMFGLLFVRQILLAWYKINNPPPPIEIWANK